MRKIAATFAKRLLYRGGYYSAVRWIGGPREKRLLVLMYHDVLPERSNSARASQSPTRPEFAAHLRAITRGYRLISLRQAINEIQSNGNLRQDSVAITFDDGEPSVFTIAYPLLREYQAPATVFLLTGWINQEMVCWWHHLRDMVSRALFTGVDSRQVSETLGFQLASLRDGIRDEPGFRNAFADDLQQSLMHLADGERSNVLERLQALLLRGVSYRPQPTPALTWDQIRVMADHRIEFEAHTRNHVNLRYADATVAEREITESKKEIEERLQRPVTGFAYPYGKDIESYRPVETILAKHGFTYAVNAVTGSNSRFTNRYSLWRSSLPHSQSGSLVGRDLAVLISRASEDPPQTPRT